MEQQSLFPKIAKPREKSKKLMHVIDAGDSIYEGFDMMCRFKCYHCQFESDWIGIETTTKAKRGIPCPKCNASLEFDEQAQQGERGQ